MKRLLELFQNFPTCPIGELGNTHDSTTKIIYEPRRIMIFMSNGNSVTYLNGNVRFNCRRIVNHTDPCVENNKEIQEMITLATKVLEHANTPAQE
jgi:hypothetical protein